jgi:hypothetical protein
MAMKTGPALLAAGVSGLIANALIASLTVGETGFFALLSDPVRWLIALAAAGLLPVIYANFRPVIRWFLAVIILTVATSLAAKLLVGVPSAYLYVVAFHAVYAAVATTVYRTLTSEV